MNILKELAEKTQREHVKKLKEFMILHEVRLGRFGSSNVTKVPTSGKFGPKPSSASNNKIFDPVNRGVSGFTKELATNAFHTAFPGLVPLHRLIVKHFLNKPKPSSNKPSSNKPSGPHPMTQMMSMASSNGVSHPMTSKMSNFGGSAGPKASTGTSDLIQKLVQKLPSSNGPIPSMFNLNQKSKPHFKMNTSGSMQSSNPRTP